MRAWQSNKGQAFLLIVIVLVGIIVAFALLSTWFVRVRYAPIVQDAFWEVDGQRVTTAKVGAEVKAHVVIRATGEYVGSVAVKIRKDVVVWFDSDYNVLTMPVNLVGGQEKEIEFVFVPDKPSGGGLRGYFIEIEFKATRTGWVMENSYPPRLRVG